MVAQRHGGGCTGAVVGTREQSRGGCRDAAQSSRDGGRGRAEVGSCRGSAGRRGDRYVRKKKRELCERRVKMKREAKCCCWKN